MDRPAHIEGQVVHDSNNTKEIRVGIFLGTGFNGVLLIFFFLLNIISKFICFFGSFVLFPPSIIWFKDFFPFLWVPSQGGCTHDSAHAHTHTQGETHTSGKRARSHRKEAHMRGKVKRACT